MAEYGLYLNVGTIVTIVLASGGIAWKLSRVEKGMRDEFDAEIDNLQRDVVKLATGGIERAETLRHEFGETGSALRTKIHEVETWNRDTFVRKESFEMVIGRIEKSIERLGDRFEEKLDKLVERIQPH